MRTHTIGLIANAESDAARTGWWEDIFRHWPENSPPPRLELLTPSMLLNDGRAMKGCESWDAAILAPFHDHLDTDACRVLDVLQQWTVPTVLLVSEPPSNLDSFHPGTIVVQPISAPGQSTAAMLFALAQRQPALRALEQSVKMAQSFQGETAAEMDRIQQELLLAAKVQRDFLPKHMPVLETVETAVLFRPASFVSGDTYDITQLDEYHISFFLADAMGHGVPAALMTLYVSGSMPRREVTKNGVRLIPPGEALERLNAELHESIAGPTRFVTGICGMIDTRTGLITLACAGHPPPLRISQHGVRPVDVGGMLLGVVPDSKYQQVTIKLEPNELLVLYSDGVEEAFAGRHRSADGTGPTVPPHYTHMAAMRRGASLESVDAAMELLANDLDSQAGSFHQLDDLTVLAFATNGVREPSSRPAATSDFKAIFMQPD